MAEQGAGTEGSGGAGAADRIREAARETAEQARSQATRVVDQIRGQAENLVNEKKAAAADQITGLATVLRKTVDELEGQELGSVAQYIGRAAEGLEEFSESIRDRDFGSLLGDVEELARRYPAMFLGGTVVAGFMFARFLKSSSGEHRAGGGGMDGPEANGTRRPQRRRTGTQGGGAGGVVAHGGEGSNRGGP